MTKMIPPKGRIIFYFLSIYFYFFNGNVSLIPIIPSANASEIIFS